MIGQLNKKYSHEEMGTISTSHQIACGLYDELDKNGYKCSVNDTNDYYFIRGKKYKRLLTNNSSVWQHIIGLG